LGPESRSIKFEDAVRGLRMRAYLDMNTPTKPSEHLSFVGTSSPRVDIPHKVLGKFKYVHDVQIPNMWHARVIRPTHSGRDSGEFIAHSLEEIDYQSIAHISPEVEVVRQGDFVAVVAPREEQAVQAARELKIKWRSIPPLVDLSNLGEAISNHP